MLGKLAVLMWIATAVVISAESPPEILRDPSFLRILSKQYSGVQTPRTQWAYRPRDDTYRYSADTSQPYTSHPYGSTLKTMQDSSSEYPNYYTSSSEYWKPSSMTNYTNSNYYYIKPSTSDTTSYQDSLQTSHSLHQYQPTRSSYNTMRKNPAYYLKGKVQAQTFDTPTRPKYKKTTLQLPTTYKKVIYPKVHKPYAKNKYPMQKTVYSPHRRYYQSVYQRYSLPSSDVYRYKQYDGYHYPSTASPTPDTTERMDDIYSDGSATSEDYTGYEDSNQKSGYYEGYEEVEKTTVEPEEAAEEETTTRGYYGDRIYMSTQEPFLSSDKVQLPNKYFIVRRVSNDDDFETIFDE